MMSETTPFSPAEMRVRQKLRDKLYEANTPLTFPIVKDEGVAVGPSFEVIYPSFGEELMVHQAWGRMTDEVLLRGLDANAIQVLEFTRLDKNTAKHIIQPRRISGRRDSPQIRIARELHQMERVEAGLARAHNDRRLRVIAFVSIAIFLIACPMWLALISLPPQYLTGWWHAVALAASAGMVGSVVVAIRIAFGRPDLFR